MIIGIWGDSITFGSCDAEELGWVGRLRRSLPTKNDHFLYNFGVCGQSSTDALKRFAVECAAIKPQKVVFAFGLNDSKFPNAGTENMVPLETYEKNMLKLIEMAREHADEIVLVGPTLVGSRVATPAHSIFQDSEIVKYRDALKELADHLKIQFIDMSLILSPDTDIEDGLHPNTQGYQKMFEHIRAELKWG